MEIEEIILNLRKRIAEFKETELYKINKNFRFDIRAIEIALNLSELRFDNNRSILESEQYWFKGGYLIANDLTGEWEDISFLYNKLVAIVKKNYW